MSIIMRPLSNERDIQRVLELRRISTTLENMNEYPTVSDLPEMLAPATRDTYRVQLWENTGNTDDTLLAFGIVDTAFRNLYFYVHPEEQGNTLESNIIGWASEQMRTIGRQQHKQVTLDTSCRENDVRKMALLEQQGFISQEEQTLRMQRSLTEPVPIPQLQEGFMARQLQREQEVVEYVTLHREAFGTSHMTVEHCLAIMNNPDYRPELDVVAVAPNGTFAAFCVCTINREVNAQSGQNEGEIGIIGTRPAYRNMGLGRVMLLEGLQRLKIGGISIATLGTTSSNAHAIRLYESVGFRVANKFLWYSKAV
jgi:mycothiol synthase